MCSPHPTLKKLDNSHFLDLSPTFSNPKTEGLKQNSSVSKERKGNKILNPTQRLSELLCNEEIEVFDLHYCL